MDDFTFRGQREDEDVLNLIKQNAWVFAKTGFVILIMANIVVFILIMFGATGFFSYILLIFVLTSGLMVGYKWYIWNSGYYLITSQRIIRVEQSGLFHRIISELELDRIQDISTEQKGPVQTFLNFGTIHIKTASSNSGLVLTAVTDPYDVQQEIVKAQNLTKNDFGGKIEFRDNFGEEVSKNLKKE